MRAKHIFLYSVYIIVVWLFFPENFPKWMRPDHCVPDEIFRWFTTVSSTYIGITYFIFAYAVKYKLGKLLAGILDWQFVNGLSLVFIFCGLEHLTAGWSMVHQYVKLAFVFVYPPLMYWHTYLLIYSKSAYEKLKLIKTDEDISNLLEDYEALKSENKTLKDTMMFSYENKHWGKIGDLVRNNEL